MTNDLMTNDSLQVKVEAEVEKKGVAWSG